jgi:hypothetical protein
MSMSVDAAFVAERIGAVLLVVALVTTVGRLLGLSAKWVAIAGLLAVAIQFVPVGGPTILAYVFSVVGPLSAASIVLLASAVAVAIDPSAGWPSRLGVSALSAVVLVLAVPFYPLALGLGPYDPYSLGFSGVLLPAGLAVLAVLGWLAGSVAILVWLALGSAMFLLGAYQSRNMIDYLIDPIAVIVAAITLISVLVARIRLRRRAPA